MTTQTCLELNALDDAGVDVWTRVCDVERVERARADEDTSEQWS